MIKGTLDLCVAFRWVLLSVNLQKDPNSTIEDGCPSLSFKESQLCTV